MKKLKITISIIMSFIIILFLFGCGGGASKESSKSIEEKSSGNDGLFTLRIVTQTGFNELNVADELGYFKDEGIKIQYTGVLGKGVTEFQLLEQGIIDAFTTSHPPNVAQARLAGVKAIIVAPGMVDNPNFPHVRYLVKKDSDIQSLDQVVNKKVAISGVGPCTDGYVSYYLKEKNIKGDVNWVTLQNGQMEQSLSQGLVDVTTSHPPYAGKALSGGDLREIGTSWDIFHSPGAGLSSRGFTEEFIKEHPQVVQGFVNALYKARLWINKNQEEAIKIDAKYLDLEPGDLSVFWYDEDKNINQKYIEEWFKVSETIGLWKAGDILPKDVYTNEFVPKG